MNAVINNNNSLQGTISPTMLQTTASDSPKTNDLFQHDDQETAIDLKGSVFTLPVLCLKIADLAKIESDLRERLSKSPQFFKNAPIVVDLESIRECADDFDFPKFVTLLRGLHLVPVGVQHGSKTQHEAAKWAGFAELKGGAIQELPTAANRRKNSAKAVVKVNAQQHTQQQSNDYTNNESPRDSLDTPADTSENAPLENNASTYAIKSIESMPTTKVIRQPVRSGQRIYHQGGDLIVLAAVNAGAEIMADGNIHVYAPLRGRALAGVQGNTEARIFCLQMESELIAIAGQYRVFENKVPPEMLGKPVQIFLEGDKIVIASLE